MTSFRMNNLFIITAIVVAAGMLIGIGGQVQKIYAQNHGDEVSSAAQIIGPGIKEDAQLQKDPGSVSDPAQIIGPGISAIAQPLTK